MDSGLGNGGDGVEIASSALGRTIGGKGAGEGNVIAHNGGDGVSITGGGVDEVLSNSIFSNGGLGIDLEDDGPTLNDVGDGDTGVNGLLNFPVLTGARVMTTSSTDIIGSITSTPFTAFRIELFSNGSCDPSGFGAGEEYLGFVTVFPDGSGHANFIFTHNAALLGRSITATVTDPNNNTSEFSSCLIVSITVDSTGDSADDAPGDGLCSAGGVCTLRAAIEEANANLGEDTILFDIIGPIPHTITPTSSLPVVTGPVVIDGTSEPDYVGTPVVELDGNNAGAGVIGLDVASGSSTISGLLINRFNGAGVVLRTRDSNKVRASHIGTDASGTVDLGNGAEGIRVESSGNLIGGAGPDDGNGIAFNGSDGVRVSSGTGNAMQGNGIFSNTGLGIDLGGNGLTANDGDDSDAGANDLQNFPVLASVTAGSTIIEGSITSNPDADLRIEYFASKACDPSGNGEGGRFLGALDVTTDGSGVADVGVVYSETVAEGEFITATATDPSGNTSEFSQCALVEVPTQTVNSTDDSNDLTCDAAHCSLREAINASNADGTKVYLIAFNISTTDPGFDTTTSAFTIKPTSALPTIIDQAIVDGYTQPGASANTNSPDQGTNAVLKIVLDGSSAGGTADGLRITAGSTIVRGLVINRFGKRGIEISGAGGNFIEGNFIGTDVTGAVDLGNADNGIDIANSTANTIGGTTPASRNVISGNNNYGIHVNGSSHLQTISGNLIGTDYNGASALGNQQIAYTLPTATTAQ